MSTSLAVQHQAIATAVQYNSDQIDLIKSVYAKGATDLELKLFVEVAQRMGLDIFRKQIYMTKRWDTDAGREVMQIQTGIDGYRTSAAATKLYDGQLGPLWCGEDGVWKDVWLSDKPPAAAKVATLRKGCREPFWGVAHYREYVQTKKDGTPNRMWKTMVANQLAKCAEALSLRKAFPAELSGVYTAEEMDQASNVIDITAESTRADSATRSSRSETVATAAEFAPTELDNFLLAECVKLKKNEKAGKAWFDTKYGKASESDKQQAALDLGWNPSAEAEEVVHDGEIVDPDPRAELRAAIDDLCTKATAAGIVQREQTRMQKGVAVHSMTETQLVAYRVALASALNEASEKAVA